jgi:hypothetical protein
MREKLMAKEGDAVQSGLQYTSTIRDFPLLYLEMKKTAILLCEGKTADEILSLSVNDNIYQLDKEKRRRSMPLKMTKRLSSLCKPLIGALADNTTDEGKLIAFLALMKAERLVGEYMLDVYADKADFDEITDLDFMQFADRLAANSDTVAGWKTDTLKDLNSKIKSILCDAGLAKRTKTGLTVQKGIVDGDFCRLLSDSDFIYAKAMLRGVV